MEWYYAHEDQQVGPLSDADFQGAVADGRVQAETLVWHEGLAEWETYGAVAAGAPQAADVEAAAVAPGSGNVVCCECGRLFTRDEVIQYEASWVCAACKPMFFQRIQEGAELPGEFVYGGFFVRLGAKIIDGIIMWVLNSAVGALLGLAVGALVPDRRTGLLLSTGLGMVLGIVIGATYATLFLGRFGATPGKMALGLKVVRPDGSPISYARACGRHFSEWISGMLFGIGYLMAAFDEEKRSLHDRICDTRVVRR